MNQPPLVSVVIVTYNGRQLLEQFTSSIAAQDYPNLECIVVVTETGDGSAEWIHSTYPHWKVVQHANNDGASADYNRGAFVATGKLIFGISNDMWFEPDCISKMARRMLADPTIGICTCKILRMTPNGQRTLIIDNLGGNIDFFGCAQAVGFLEEDRGQCDGVDEVFFSYGGAMMIRKTAFDRAGGYDGVAFALADDVDLSWRVRLLGYKVVVEPAAVLYHRVSATLSKVDRGQRRFWSERNTLRMLLKNYSAPTLFWVLPCYTILLFMELAFYISLRRWDVGSRVLAAAIWNLTHWRETRLLRRQIQTSRVIPDWAILRRANKFSWKLGVAKDVIRNPSVQIAAFFGRPTSRPS